MHPADITAALKKAGSSQAQIARDLDVSRAAVWFVIAGRKTSKRIAHKVSSATGFSVQKLWPGKYIERSKQR